jgi:TATA-binding protein-associated factor
MNFKWTYCVLDEGHLLKNPKTLTAKAARKLRSQHRLILSGTPIQNNVNELWSAFDWLMPNYLGNEREFANQYGRFITKGHLPGASSKEIRISMDKLKQLHQKVLPFILRRKKEDVLRELPSKIISDIPCTMTEIQQHTYANFLTKKDMKRALELLERLMDEDGDRRKIDVKYQGPKEQNVLKSLLSLRLICTHPALVSERGHLDGLYSTARFDASGKLLALNDLLRRSDIFHDETTGADNDESLLYLDNEEMETSSTAAILNGDADDGIFEQGTLEDTSSSNSKCLIFGQYCQSLDAVEDLLFKPHMPSLNYVRLDGKTSVKDRGEIVESFQTDPAVKCMLLTSKVGSLGLNLQAADTVIFLENDWNPFVDLQAMDRCHRIGQQHNVKVYRLITRDTIEEKIMAVQKVKLAMSDAVVNTDNTTMYSMGTDRLLDLFTTQD